MNKDDKIYLKFISKYSFITKNRYFCEASLNHFDNNFSFVGFTLALLENRIGEEKFYNNVKINQEDWCDLFIHLYQNTKIKEAFQRLEINPIIPYDQIINLFECFDDFIDETVSFFKREELNLNIHESELKKFLKDGYGYLLYNKVSCNLPLRLNKILVDPKYDTKIITILNNTKLFSAAKQHILNNCKNNVNTFIVLILGMSKSLSCEN